MHCYWNKWENNPVHWGLGLLKSTDVFSSWQHSKGIPNGQKVEVWWGETGETTEPGGRTPSKLIVTNFLGKLSRPQCVLEAGWWTSGWRREGYGLRGTAFYNLNVHWQMWQLLIFYSILTCSGGTRTFNYREIFHSEQGTVGDYRSPWAIVTQIILRTDFSSPLSWGLRQFCSLGSLPQSFIFSHTWLCPLSFFILSFLAISLKPANDVIEFGTGF